jgi:hypothetical protein
MNLVILSYGIFDVHEVIEMNIKIKLKVTVRKKHSLKIFLFFHEQQ